MAKQVYHITTKERAYNHVEGANRLEAKAEFQTVRDNWDDTSKVISVFRWNRETGTWDSIKATSNW